MIDWLTGIGALAGAALSARWNWWRPTARGVPILMYHKVGDPPPGSRLKSLWVTVKNFRRQMLYLREHGYKPVTFAGLADLLDRGEPLPEKAVVITFDDGYRNTFENAYPVLKEFGYAAVVFLVVNSIGGDNFWHDPAMEGRIPMMGWKEVEEMQSAGFEFGSHTLTHPRLTRVWAQDARREIEGSRAEMARRLGRAPLVFANPYGDGSDDPFLQQTIREAGYRWAVSVHQGLADFAGSPYCLKRLFIRGDDILWDFHLNLTRGRARF